MSGFEPSLSEESLEAETFRFAQPEKTGLEDLRSYLGFLRLLAVALASPYGGFPVLHNHNF